ncbi:hypothetical protein GETHLI_05650 [Geothrix limicola]|uniref:Uncharacterized protein n=1 Tax=Geothrix limicola TaxID=2927978 RepID=A0ABQ5QBT7_9BACT|nr:hypothetical protein [Geothrix limicola]GLH72063.1 hypothetical protein GETHLI_05650 [Geothrix limicola]
MPPGNQRTKIPAKVIEKATAEACVAIAHRVARVHFQGNDPLGSKAAEQVARFIEEELLGAPHMEGGQGI